MDAYEILDLEKETTKGSFGILEPINEVVEDKRLIKPEEIDLVIVPGVAFDKNMNRIGFGGGFYDRYLSLLKSSCKKVGLAYQFQIVEKIETEEHDMKVDMIVTES